MEALPTRQLAMLAQHRDYSWAPFIFEMCGARLTRHQRLRDFITKHVRDDKLTVTEEPRQRQLDTAYQAVMDIVVNALLQGWINRSCLRTGTRQAQKLHNSGDRSTHCGIILHSAQAPLLELCRVLLCLCCTCWCDLLLFFVCV